MLWTYQKDHPDLKQQYWQQFQKNRVELACGTQRALKGLELKGDDQFPAEGSVPRSGLGALGHSISQTRWSMFELSPECGRMPEIERGINHAMVDKLETLGSIFFKSSEKKKVVIFRLGLQGWASDFSQPLNFLIYPSTCQVVPLIEAWGSLSHGVRWGVGTTSEELWDTEAPGSEIST